MTRLPIRCHVPALRRAVIVAAIVGPILAMINHGDAILTGSLQQADLVRMGLTFLVPFCVSLVSSLLAVAPLSGRSPALTHDPNRGR